jgi:hypothetical protein
MIIYVKPTESRNNDNYSSSTNEYSEYSVEQRYAYDNVFFGYNAFCMWVDNNNPYPASAFVRVKLSNGSIA